MRLLFVTLALLATGWASAAVAETCRAEDVAAAVDTTGATLRRYTMETAPQLQPRLKALAAKKGWPEEGYEETAFGYLKDAKVTKLDETATGLLAKIDALGELRQGEAVDCARVEGIRVAGVELVAVMKAKTAHLLTRIDTELGTTPSAAAPKTAAATPPAASAAPEPKAPAASPPLPTPKVAAAAPTTGPAAAPPPVTTAKSVDVTKAPAAPKPADTGKADGWSARATATPPPLLPGPSGVTGEAGPPRTGETTVAVLPPAAGDSGPRADGGDRPSAALTSPPTITDEDGYTIEEIRDATRGFFGSVSTGLASVIEHAFRRTGRPTGYVLGTEGGAAFIGGLRYGRGTMFLRTGGRQEVFWQGPSLGFDFGAAGTRVMFLVYRLRAADDIYRTFTGIDGSAFVVGGVGLTLLGGGNMILAPIRSGVGVRVGASIGYIRFTPQRTWNPF
jgi:hypothetical protein